MELLGYFGAVLMGLSLGLIGGGGSVLTVPIMVYLFRVEPVLATAYSLFCVGLTSLAGALSHIRMGNIHWRMSVVFGIPSILAVYATRAWLLPAIPDPILQVGSFTLSRSLGILLLFALVVMAAGYSMIHTPWRRKAPAAPDEAQVHINHPLLVVEGAVVGVVTGIVGAGGGFIMIPTLVLLAKLPMKQAVGTSLTISAAKSLIGFTGDLKSGVLIDWPFLLVFSSIAIGGIITGSLLSRYISNEKLKPGFGWFVLSMGIYMVGRELTGWG